MSARKIVTALVVVALAVPLVALADDLQVVAAQQPSFHAGAAELPAELLQLPADERTWMEKVPRDFLLGAASAGGELDCIVVFRQPEGLRDFSAAAFDHPGRLRWIAETAAEIEGDLAPLGVKVLRRYSHLPMAHVTLPAGMLATLAGDPRVDSVSPNRIAHAFRAEGKALMHVPQVQTLGYSGSGVTVAVLDSGVDYTHSELSPGGTTTAAKTIKGADTIDNDGDPMDGEGHGTECSGIIAGSLGGVAPSAKIYAVRVLDSTGNGSSDQILAGINDVVNRVSGGNPFNIKVMNMSLGGYFDTGVPPQPCDADVPEFVTPMQTLLNAGVLPVLSAGNGGCTTGVAWPACISTTLSVGAVYDANIGSASFGEGECTPSGCSDTTTAADAVTCYSDSGAARLDVWGPSHCSTTTALGGGYENCFGGTSAAAPYVSGVAALLTQAVPGRTATGLKDALRNNGVNVTDPRNGVTKKSVRADSALTALQGGSCTAPGVPAGLASNKSSTCSGQAYTVSWNAVTGAANYTLEIATDAGFTNKINLNPSTFTGTSVNITITGTYVGPLYHHVRANASCGASSAYSSAMQVSYTGNNCSTPTYTKTYYVSGIARTPGVVPAYWYSDLGILNHGTGSAQVQVRFFGNSTPAPFTATIVAG
ncbi:MAG: S8 family serine peptidase, partial [Acidobacteria bacterium]|nr:S8 family serine peptidase [Acidobacteriota bacterium]